MHTLIKILLTGFVSFLLSSCTTFIKPYSIEVQQGNVLDADDVASIHVGMSQHEVRSRLGNPVLENYFDHNRLDYIYYLKQDKKAPTMTKITLHLKNNVVDSIE